MDIAQESHESDGDLSRVEEESEVDSDVEEVGPPGTGDND